MAGDGGEWLRRQVYTLASSGAAPVAWWLSLPLVELRDWIMTHNEVYRREK